MAYSFSIFYLISFIILILVIFSTIICFYAPSFLNPPTNTSSTVADSNNKQAQNMLYGAGIVGIVILFLILFSIYNVYSRSGLDEKDNKKLEEEYFGYGTLLLIFITFLIGILMLFLIIYGISLIDTTPTSSTSTTPNPNATTARSWTVAAAVMIAIAMLFFVFIDGYTYYRFNTYLNDLINPIEKALSKSEPTSKLSLDDLFVLTRNPKEKGVFKGKITLVGTVSEPATTTFYQGKEIKNLAAGLGEEKKINMMYDVSDRQSEQQAYKPIQQQQQQPEQQPSIKQRQTLNKNI